MEFVKAGYQDVADVLKLYRRSFRSAWLNTGRRFDTNFVKKSLRLAFRRDFCLVLRDKTRLVAFGWGRKQKDHFGNPFGEIVLLLVERAYQKHGIGSSLLEALEEKLPGDKRLVVLAGNESIRLYRRKGYGVFGYWLRKK